MDDEILKMLIPMTRRAAPTIIANDIVGVQPMMADFDRWDRVKVILSVTDDGVLVVDDYIWVLNHYASSTSCPMYAGQKVSEKAFFIKKLQGGIGEDNMTRRSMFMWR